MIYLKNAMGENTEHGVIPLEVLYWYRTLDFNNSVLNYLVYHKKRYGIQSLIEIPHPFSDDWNETREYYPEWADKTDKEVIESIQKWKDNIKTDVFLDESTGIHGRHELWVWTGFRETQDALAKNVARLNKVFNDLTN
jgi:hypothetical protein